MVDKGKEAYQFLPTPSARRATGLATASVASTTRFLPTPSARRATAQLTHSGINTVISTHALREEGDNFIDVQNRGGVISTHALREEGDRRPHEHQVGSGISTHALREEGDVVHSSSEQWSQKFLPTPSARRATFANQLQNCSCRFLPTPSARRATFAFSGIAHTSNVFLPTPSARRATWGILTGARLPTVISTHALREEGDPVGGPDDPGPHHFYPRPPRGGRQTDV